MAELSQKVFESDESRIILERRGGLGIVYNLKQGEGAVEEGQVMALDHITGKVVKYDVDGLEGTGINIAFGVCLEGKDSTAEEVGVLLASPGTTINKAYIKGLDLETNFKAVTELYTNGILLKGMDGHDN